MRLNYCEITQVSGGLWHGGVQLPADCLSIKLGQRRYLPNVHITLEADWCCNLAITWTRATPTCLAELCVVMTNLSPSGWVLRHYLKRMHVEESFRDDKSGYGSMNSENRCCAMIVVCAW